MAANSPARRALTSTIAALERHHGPDDPRLPVLRRSLLTAKTADYLQAAIDATPPLSADDRLYLAGMLTNPRSGGEAA